MYFDLLFFCLIVTFTCMFEKLGIFFNNFTSYFITEVENVSIISPQT